MKMLFEYLQITGARSNWLVGAHCYNPRGIVYKEAGSVLLQTIGVHILACERCSRARHRPVLIIFLTLLSAIRIT
jgi:hypothetical protein